ncbi:aldo/keto reductase [Spirochaetota bacterium]
MKRDSKKIGRKSFLKGLGQTTVSTSLLLLGYKQKKGLAADKSKTRFPQVPKRKLGKTGTKVPCLSLGMNFNTIGSQLILHKAFQWGITYWDTANSYAGGNSELGIGKFIKKNRHLRKKLFLVTKASHAESPKEVEKRLQLSLKRMNTSYIDLYYGYHALTDPDDLTKELARWAERAKKRNLIRHFGFSTHNNMAECLMKASKLKWIDAIMLPYNFMLKQNKEMQKAVDACRKANIGLIAMKVQGKRMRMKGSESIYKHFIKKGYTEGQAKIKYILEDKKISSACVMMESVSLITENAAAVIDKSKLSVTDRIFFQEYARQSACEYCAGCSSICNRALPEAPYVSHIMRYLMYHNSYGHEERARMLFSEIPIEARNRLLKADFTIAEAKCPQNLPIASLVAEAFKKLS